jgi:16S rRNA (adenine1518-N6/adenine1519-N6)-dimethyltransferase
VAVVTLSRRQVREVLDAHGLAPRRALGQNFVVDANTVRRIARLSGVGPGTPVIEIGAGLGALTLALVETGAHVTAVEVDRGLVPVLRTQVEPHGVRVVEADALVLDWAELVGSSGSTPDAPPWAMVANLPYNVAVPVVLRALDEAPALQSMLVMVQREVGERLAAGPDDKAYGAVSVKVAYHATARVVGRVPASVFVPRPAVESALVRIERRPQVAVDPDVVPAARLFEVVRAGFGHRRKMLRQSLADVVGPDAFAVSGINPEARAENLGVEEWGRLAACALENPAP